MAVNLLLCLLCGLSLSAAYVLRAAPDDDAIAYISSNQTLRGSKKTLPSNDVIYTFLGIRYASAPTGDGRFDKPSPAPEWSGTKDAVAVGPKCLQSITPSVPESEDCLFLNVYSPTLNGSLPVMLWIHGGVFYAGTGNEFDGSLLAAKGVVVVTINYRLGPFGFLSTGDDAMPGNYGLMDQLMALQWVQQNIFAFGGDPAQVTIFGESAGAASVSLLTLSPLANGLFQRAVMQSGFAFCPWAVERPNTRIKLQDFTSLIGSQLGCSQGTVSELVQCLRQADANQLLLASMGVRQSTHQDILATPRVETTFGFLPDYPETLLSQGNFNKVDTLRGYNSGEYASIISDPEDDGVSADDINAVFETLRGVYPIDKFDDVIQLAEGEYLANVTTPLEKRSQLVNALTDVLFAAAGILELNNTLAQKAPGTKHYLYELDYLHSNTVTPPWMGVAHARDLQLVFFNNDPNATSTDRQVADSMQTMWTNFAKSGDPSLQGSAMLKWDEYTSDGLNILVIDSTSKMSTFPRPEAVSLYDKILQILLKEPATSSIVG